MSELFLATQPTLEDYWRGIILFGRDVASYKFSLAQALLELKAPSECLIELDELACSRHICNHLRETDKQGTSVSSKFPDALPANIGVDSKLVNHCEDASEQRIESEAYETELSR